jgi:rhodanese-related sulfurtransferase
MSAKAPRRWTPSLARLPRSVVLALLLAAPLFAGGYAAGQGAERVVVADPHGLERQAAPLAGGVGVVTPEQVLATDAGHVQLVDVRGRDAYAFSHATGAISMPESEMVGMAGALPRDRTLVLYCSCPDEKTSLRAARTLSGVFHVPRLVVLKGGLDAYAAAGGAVTSAASDSGLEHRGCGCSTNAPAFKLWAGNLAAERERQDDSSK